MPAPDLATLLVQETKEQIYEYALAIASLIGLPVSSWEPGDPTRSEYLLEAELLEKLEAIVVGFISSDFLDYAVGDWLKVVAKQKFNVDVPGAVAASTDVVLTNAGKRVYDEIEPGDLIFRNTLTGATYRNSTGGNLPAKVGATDGTLTVTVVAEQEGSEGSAGAGEIDDLVTTLLGVTCSNPLAAIGIDEQPPAVTIQQCRDKLGSLSPNGAKGAYAYVARNPDLTGTRAVTRVRVFGDSDIGEVTIYLGGPSGAIASPDRDLVEAAIVKWALPLCVTPTVLSATNVPVPITYELWLYKSVNRSVDEAEADVLAALEDLFGTRETMLAGDIIAPATTGKLYVSLIETTIKGVFEQAFRVSVTLPGADVALANSEVATLGAVTATIHILPDP